MKPICVPCLRFYKPKDVGIAFTEGFPQGESSAKPGTAEPEKWKPYKLWMGDLWQCPGCGAQIIHGTGERPIAEHYETDFKANMERHKPTLQVNDC